MLALPDYSHEFVVETDASHRGIGVVLMQKGRPIAYFSKVLAPNIGVDLYMRSTWLC